MERVQPGGGPDQELTTWYTLDAFGNRIGTATCSNHFSEAACKGAISEFAPADPLRVQRQSRRTFDSRGRYPTSTREIFRNGSGITEQAVSTVLARDVHGNVTQARDLVGAQVQAVSGSMGRAYYSWAQSVPGAPLGAAGEGVTSLSSYRWCGTAAQQVPCLPGAVFRETVQVSGAATQWRYYDRLGRVVLAVSQGFQPNLAGRELIGQCTHYDVRSRAERSSEPFFHPASAGEPVFSGNTCAIQTGRYWTRSVFDALDRPVDVQHPDGTSSRVAYTGLTTTFTDPLSKIRSEVRNALGELVTSTDPGGLSVSYTYDPTGNLLRARRDGGRGVIDSTQTYDRLGRKISQIDPDAGSRTYAYNAAGELIRQTDGKGQAIHQRYDARGRLVEKLTFSSPGVLETTQTFVYDGNANGRGQLHSERVTGTYAGWAGQAAVAHNYLRTLTYDVMGRPIGVATTIDGVSYHMATQYDHLGRAWKSQDVTGRWLKTQISPSGAKRVVCDSSAVDAEPLCPQGSAATHQRIVEYDARGNIVRESRGDTIDILRAYHPANGRLLEVCTGSTCQIQNESYVWDDAGNLRSRDFGGQFKEEFTYDDLHRVTEGRYARVLGTTYTGANRPVSLQASYDRLGNICSKTIGGSVQAYAYAGRAGCGTGGLPGSGTTSGTSRPHAVTGADGGVFSYDANGNQTVADYVGTARDRYIRYTVENQAHEIALSSQANPTQRSRFWYGPGGERYKREDHTPGVGLKRTLYLGNVELIQQNGTTTTRRYVAGVMVQEIVGAVATNRYLFHDHLGSVVRVTTRAGAIIEGMAYGVFGERRGWANPTTAPTVPTHTNRGYTGHEMLDGLDIVHMNGRIYDSRLGRFLQPDPVVQEGNNPQNFNRYSYVLNNPLAYTDPSGYNFVKKYWRAIVAIAITWVTGGIAASYGWSWAGAAWAAGGGFAAGVVAGGGLRGGLAGAFTGVATLGIANVAGLKSFGKHMATATSGGVSSVIAGGKFGHGFVSAGVGSMTAPGIRANIKNGFGRAVVSGLVGGAVSELTGGKFANGAVTAAMQFAFSSAASRAAARRVDDYFEHSSFPEGAEDPQASPMPRATRRALSRILRSPYGRQLSAHLDADGGKISLVEVPAHEAFTVIGDNEIWYTRDVGAFRAAAASAGRLLPGDGMSTATLDTLLVHELGHTMLGSAAIGQTPIPVTSLRSQFQEEARAVRYFENPYRAYRGLPARCSYFTQGDMCR